MEVVGFENLLIFAALWLHALDRDTGEVVWSFAPVEDFDWPGRWMTLADNRLFGAGRKVYRLDPRNGAVLWERDVGEYLTGPTFSDGVVYFGGQGVVGTGFLALGEGHATALDAENGEILWRTLIPDHPTGPLLGGVVGRGALTDELFIVAARNGRVYGLDRATGAERWMHEGTSPYASGVAILGDVAVVGSSNPGGAEGLDVASGERLWWVPLGSSVQRVAFGGGLALVANGRLYGLDSMGREQWGFGGVGWGHPPVVGGATLGDGLAVASSASAGLFALPYPY